ncbi:MAG TPA: hypothetical protein VNK26_05410, partial [Pyrinomonadaceae bacterium]|nr:hypothetical protein [Pyrinomonadaceae bacterium]
MEIIQFITNFGGNLAMMSVHRFRREALLYYYRKKSPMIQDIETLLKEYHRTDSENKKMKCLVYIYLMCKHYLSTKALGKRRDGIQTLLEETKQILDSPGFMTKIQNKARGLHYSSGYKTRITSTTNSFKTLEPTYQIEGILPQKNFVDKMNLHWEQFLDAPKYLGANDLTFEVRVENDRQYLLDWTQSTVTDALDVYYENWTKGYDRQFVYLNAEQRQQYLMRVGAGRIYNYLTNTPFAGETSLISPG